MSDQGFSKKGGDGAPLPYITISSPSANATLAVDDPWTLVVAHGGYNQATYAQVQVFMPGPLEPVESYWATWLTSFGNPPTSSQLMPGLPAGSYEVLVTYHDAVSDEELATYSISITVQ